MKEIAAAKWLAMYNGIRYNLFSDALKLIRIPGDKILPRQGYRRYL